MNELIFFLCLSFSFSFSLYTTGYHNKFLSLASQEWLWIHARLMTLSWLKVCTKTDRCQEMVSIRKSFRVHTPARCWVRLTMTMTNKIKKKKNISSWMSLNMETYYIVLQLHISSIFTVSLACNNNNNNNRNIFFRMITFLTETMTKICDVFKRWT